MIVAEFDADSLARVRIAPSPVHEAVTWLRLLVGPDRGHPFLVHDPAAVRAATRHPDVRMTARILAGATAAGYVPDFMLPPPDNGPCDQVAAAQLDAVASTPQQVVDEHVAALHAFGGRVDARVTEHRLDGSLARRVGRGLEVFWRTVVAPSWSARGRAYATDLQYRSGLTSTHGVGALITSLHPSLHWDRGQLRAPSRFEECLSVRSSDVVLVPSLAQWPGCSLQLCGSGAAIVYPVPGAEVDRRPDVADAELLGAGRAAVLAAVHVPQSTREVGRSTGLADSTVSYHLQVLLRSELVARRRLGRRVVYVQTTRGHGLVGSLSR